MSAPERPESGEAGGRATGAGSSARHPALLLLLGLAFLAVVTKNAWLCDDAYISFRTVENAVLGHGLVWNPGERVQTFTNPLWTLLLVPARLVTGELWGTTLALSILLGAATAFALARAARNQALAVLALVALLASRAVTDFTTSGLENPLGHLCLVAFVLQARRMHGSPRAFLGAALCAGLAAVNRMDALLLCLPALALGWWRLPRARATGLLLLGFAPFLVWELFALVYYGFPFPNTAYAKLGAGIERLVLVRQGLAYLRHSLANDPATLVATLFCGWCVARERSALALSALAGLVAGLAYVLWVGGDFMSGRFLAAPLVCAVAWCASGTARAGRGAWVASALLLACAALAPRSHFWSGSDYGRDPADRMNAGFVNIERAFYFQTTGLTVRRDPARFEQHPWIEEGRELRRRAEAGSEAVVRVSGAIGFLGFQAGPRVKVYDIFALADPLLARLPAEEVLTSEGLAIGHFARLVPQGFVPARAHDAPLADPALERLDRSLALVTRGPLFTCERWRAIWRLNTGGHAADVAEYVGRPPLGIGAEQLAAGGGVALDRNGAEVRFAETLHVAALELDCDPGSVYELRFLLGDAEHGRVQSNPTAERGRLRGTPVPDAAQQAGFDRVRVAPLFGLGEYRLVSIAPGS